ncbi:MAG: hypothetical protein E7362_02760 [Clostridiales bacterium]|nr:hypothetical protein [Clostridiales bacterium]
MNFIDVLIFLKDYSLPTIIIAFAVSVVFFILDKVLKNKIPTIISTVLPPICCILIYFVYQMAFVNKGFFLSLDTVYAGIVCASLSLMISAIIKRLAKDPIGTLTSKNLSPSTLAIEEIICDFVKEENLNNATEKVLDFLASNLKTKEDQAILVNELACILAEFDSKNNSETELLAIAKTIILSYGAIENL